MHYLKRLSRKNGDEAVSPVVGVMLMLVVTIVIAAVVSGFAGGLVGGSSRAPSLTMDVKITNTGYYIGSGFTATVMSVSEPIATNNLKIVTSWTTRNGNTGITQTGGNTSQPLVTNVGTSVAPYGFGPGVLGTQNLDTPSAQPNQYFGNYTLEQGTGLVAEASSTGYGTSTIDPATAVLGANWWNMNTGDTVTVTVIHVPTGKVIFQKDVVVTEG